MVIFDSAALIVHPSPRDFAEGINPPSVFARSRDDQPDPAASLAWYMYCEEHNDISDPRDWDADEAAYEAALIHDAQMCGLIA